MTEVRLNADELRFSLLETLTFLAASAHGAVESQKLYGPLRLMEAAERIIRLMDACGLADEELRELAEQIVAMAMPLATDAEQCSAFTNEITLLLTHRLKAAVPDDGG